MHFKKYGIIFILILCLSIIISGCKNASTESDIENSSLSVDKENEEVVISDTELFETYLKEVLIPQYGVLNRKQTGTMRVQEDKWLDFNGILSSLIFDFDNDDNTELLICRSQENNSNNYKRNFILMEMYEIHAGEVILSDSIPFSQYSDNASSLSCSVEFSENFSLLCSLYSNIVNVNDNFYIVCEDQQSASAFADGQNKNFWILQYFDDKFNYISSFYQSNGGSSGFEYTFYKFNNGEIFDKEVYYNEMYDYDSENEDKPKHKKFGDALSEYLKHHNMIINPEYKNAEYSYDCDLYKSILSDKNEITNIFNLKNTLTNSDSLDWENLNCIFEFELIAEELPGSKTENSSSNSSSTVSSENKDNQTSQKVDETSSESLSSNNSSVTSSDTDKKNYSYKNNKKLYNDFLLNGGFEKITEDSYMEESSAKYETCLIDFDNDGIYELYLSIINEEGMNIRGYETITALLGIKDNKVYIIKKAYNGGGSMGGDSLFFKYDSQEKQPVVMYQTFLRDGIFYNYCERNVYTFNKKLSLINNSCSEFISTSSDVYKELLDEAEKIRKETSLYKEDSEGLYTYKISDEYVSEKEYNKVSKRFIDTTDKKYKLVEGSFDNPLGS